MTQTFTVNDVILAGHTLEPLRCLHCGHVGEVTFLQYVGDGQCAYCGEWQLEPENDNNPFLTLPVEELERDYRDTTKNIEGFRQLSEAYSTIAVYHHSQPERILARFKANAYADKEVEALALAEKLIKAITARKEKEQE